MQLESVGEVVRILRARRGLDQIDLARECGWRDASAVSRIETDRIRPTRRTLDKLADSLSDPRMPLEQVRAWLYCAAGIPPTREDVERVRASLPALDANGCPIYLSDFSWTVWQANPACAELFGLPERHAGRNLLEMYFEDGPCRKKAGDGWNDGAERMLRRFREETARRTSQRWYTSLVGRLRTYDGFDTVWTKIDDPATAAGGGNYRIPLSTDPRFALVPVFDPSAPAAPTPASLNV